VAAMVGYSHGQRPKKYLSEMNHRARMLAIVLKTMSGNIVQVGNISSWDRSSRRRSTLRLCNGCTYARSCCSPPPRSGLPACRRSPRARSTEDLEEAVSHSDGNTEELASQEKRRLGEERGTAVPTAHHHAAAEGACAGGVGHRGPAKQLRQYHAENQGRSR
jgi:hypothetical protein